MGRASPEAQGASRPPEVPLELSVRLTDVPPGTHIFGVNLSDGTIIGGHVHDIDGSHFPHARLRRRVPSRVRLPIAPEAYQLVGRQLKTPWTWTWTCSELPPHHSPL